MRPIASFVVVLFLVLLRHAQSNEPTTPAANASQTLGTLHLIGGDVYRGEMRPSKVPATKPDRKDSIDRASNMAPQGELVWKCPAFDADLVVPWSQVERLTQPLLNDASVSSDDASRTRSGEFIFQLHNGESIAGQILQFDEKTIEIESPYAGKQTLRTDSLLSILRCIENTSTQGGLVSISGWRQMNPPMKPDGRSKWFEQTGTYNTETTGTSIAQVVDIPDLAAIDVDVAWEQANPNWTLTIGEPRRLELHFRKIETRRNISISILVDGESTADVDTALMPSDGLTSISLKILCDSNRGRYVLLHSGTVIAQLQLAKATRVSGTHSLAFTNFGLGRVSVREIRIYPSIFSMSHSRPKPQTEDAISSDLHPEILLRSGDIVQGRLSPMDSVTRSFDVATNDAVGKRILMSDVDRIEFPTPLLAESSDSAVPMYVAELKSGARYVGQTVVQDADSIAITLDRVPTIVRIPIRELKLVGLTTPVKRTDASIDSAARWMRLVSPWAISTGAIDSVAPLKDGKPASDIPHMFWKPKVANSVPLNQKLSGVVEPLIGSPETRTVAPKSAYPVVRPGQKKAEPDLGRPLKTDDPSLFLKSGDCFPATVTLVDEKNTQFKSTLFERGVVPNEQVQGIRVLDYNSDSIEKGARKKLLTLPRAQRTNPPTHLIVSRQGDAIRGRLKGLTEDIATLEVRGSEHSIQMKTVAEIVWLPDPPEVVPPSQSTLDNTPLANSSSNSEIPKSKSETTVETTLRPEPTDGRLRCLALFSTGTRYQFTPTQIDNGVLLGVHPELGKCQVELSRVSRLVFGDEMNADSQWNWFGKWQLENAPDPKFVNDLDDPAANSGASESAHTKMIGAAAPDFELKKLDGKAIRLLDLKGRIVVLDFWATWCGPCVASLPKLNEIAQEYKGAKVELLAINIEQKPLEIQALLNRLEINPTVLLDSDGAVARAYRAQAIPQTVIIDRDGRVAYILVGGGGDATEKKIRESINLLLEAGQ